MDYICQMKARFLLKTAIAASLLFPGFNATAQHDHWYIDTESQEHTKKMEWWRDAKFGMFIHWGIYSVTAGIWTDRNNHTEWLMQEAKIPMREYQKLQYEFNPTDFKAEEIAALAKAAGQKYVVLTTKHHDGFAMFDTKVDSFSITKGSPYGKDIFKELSDAVRAKGLHTGAYYSQGMDWNHIGGWVPDGKEWDPDHIGSYADYLDKVSLPQMHELMTNYGDIDLLWFDAGSTIMDIPLCNRIDSLVHCYPSLITNNRLECKRRDFPGDYFTPEQYIPAVVFTNNDWEVCMTMNGHWCYCAYDENWKSTKDLVRILAEVVAKGGNLLLNIGPDRKGNVPEICQRELKEIGDWLQTNGEAIYGTRCSPYQHLPFGWATRKGNMLYLLIRDWEREIALPETIKVKNARLLAAPSVKIKSMNKDGRTWFSLPEYAPDDKVSVLAVECNSPVELMPAESADARITLNGEEVKDLNDNNFIEKWEAREGLHECVFDIELPRERTIRNIIIVEAFHPWDGMGQDYILEALDGNVWRTVSEGKSKGLGYNKSFEDTKARHFRLTVRNPKIQVTIKEILLNG